MFLDENTASPSSSSRSAEDANLQADRTFREIMSENEENVDQNRNNENLTPISHYSEIEDERQRVFDEMADIINNQQTPVRRPVRGPKQKRLLEMQVDNQQKYVDLQTEHNKLLEKHNELLAENNKIQKENGIELKKIRRLKEDEIKLKHKELKQMEQNGIDQKKYHLEKLKTLQTKLELKLKLVDAQI